MGLWEWCYSRDLIVLGCVCGNGIRLCFGLLRDVFGVKVGSFCGKNCGLPTMFKVQTKQRSGWPRLDSEAVNGRCVAVRWTSRRPGRPGEMHVAHTSMWYTSHDITSLDFDLFLLSKSHISNSWQLWSHIRRPTWRYSHGDTNRQDVKLLHYLCGAVSQRYNL